MNYSFNLLDHPWVPCLDSRGRSTRLSLPGVLDKAPQLRNISHASPLVVASVTRLLLAVLHRVFGPGSVSEWENLWRAGRFDPAALDTYFQHWRHRFDLFDPEHPFYQCPGIDQRYASPISKLIHDAASGNNATLFDHTLDESPPPLTPPDAALHLVARQAFSEGGLVTCEAIEFKSAQASPLLKAAVALVQGDSLFQTLLLNLHRYSPQDGIPFSSKSDRPAWESDTPISPGARHPLGYLDLLTWQSRRVLLYPQGDSDAPVVNSAALMMGCQLPDGYSLRDKETTVAFKKLERPAKGQDPWIPVGFQLERAVWRDAHALFRTFPEASERPRLMDWLDQLICSGGLSLQRTYSVLVCGLCADRAKLLSWHHENIPLPSRFIHEPALADQIRVALDWAEQGERILVFAIRVLAGFLLKPQNDQSGALKPDKETQRALARSLHRGENYWASLQFNFSQLLTGLTELPESASIDLPPQPGSPLDNWLKAVRHAALDAFSNSLRAAGQSPRAMKACAQAELSFRKSLSRLSFTTTTQEVSTSVSA